MRPMKLQKSWSTHMPMVIKTIQLTTGPVLELGAGIFSTPLIHWLCAESRRKVVTYDDTDDYYHFALKFRSRTHKVIKIEDWSTFNEPEQWSVVLIDQSADSRAMTAIKLKDNAYFIVLHDSNEGNEHHYKYSTVYPHFKYRHDWTFSEYHTTVISNFDDLTRLK